MIQVSTIIPAYNAERTIRAAIDSALAQNFDGQEIIVVNDGSTDSTASILEGFRDRIKIVTQPNRGVAAARNAGVRESTSEYLAFLDSDDLWLSGKLTHSVGALDANPHAVLAFSDCIALNDDGRTETPWHCGRAPSLEELLRGNWVILPSAVTMRRVIFDKCGGFPEAFRRPGGDDPFMWLMTREHGEFVYLPQPLTIYRVTPAYVLADKYAAGVSVFIRLVRQRYPEHARAITRQVYRERSAYLLAKAGYQLGSRNYRGGVCSVLAALYTSPSHVLGPSVLRRILHRRNLVRLKTILLRTGSS